MKNFTETLKALDKHNKVKDLKCVKAGLSWMINFLVNGKNGVRKISMRFGKCGETPSIDHELDRVYEFVGDNFERHTFFGRKGDIAGIQTVKLTYDEKITRKLTEIDARDPKKPITTIATWEDDPITRDPITPRRKKVIVGGQEALDRKPYFHIFSNH